LHFDSWGCLEAVFYGPDFASKPRIYKLCPLISIQLLGWWNNIGCKLMVISRANFHIEDYDLKLTYKYTRLWSNFECVRAKICQILIRLLGCLLWSFVPFKMDIFWILAKFWISKVIYGNIYVIKNGKNYVTKVLTLRANTL
jgi:hypothetical protein